MTYWWDYFNIQKPEFLDNNNINSTDLSTLTKNMTGMNVKYIQEKSDVAPMRTNYLFPGIIWFSSNYDQLKTSIYHEVGHLKTLPYAAAPLLDTATDGQSFLIEAEFLAEKEALKLAEQHNDETAINDLLNIVIIDRIIHSHRKRKEHFYARERLLTDIEYVTIAKKHVDFNQLLNYANEWNLIVKTPEDVCRV